MDFKPIVVMLHNRQFRTIAKLLPPYDNLLANNFPNNAISILKTVFLLNL